MIIVYDSLTGQCERFASRLGETVVDILDYEDDNGEDVLLVTRSWDFGKVTDEAREFLESHSEKVKGVAVGGNRNWGTNFGAAGVKIEREYGIELILKFEGSGFSQDVEYVKDWISKYKERVS